MCPPGLRRNIHLPVFHCRLNTRHAWWIKRSYIEQQRPDIPDDGLYQRPSYKWHQAQPCDAVWQITNRDPQRRWGATWNHVGYSSEPAGYETKQPGQSSSILPAGQRRLLLRPQSPTLWDYIESLPSRRTAHGEVPLFPGALVGIGVLGDRSFLSRELLLAALPVTVWLQHHQEGLRDEKERKILPEAAGSHPAGRRLLSVPAPSLGLIEWPTLFYGGNGEFMMTSSNRNI